jgi:TRAP-type transport system periplasmic protein
LKLRHISRLARGAALALALTASFAAAGQELKVASIAPDGSGWMRAMRAGAEQVREETGGRVVIKFYPGGVMGNDAQILRRIRVGQLQGGAFTSGGLSAQYAPLSLYGIPLVFRSLEEVDHVRSLFDPVLQSGLEEAGFVSFGFIEGGFAEFMSNEPVRSVDDMARRKVWIPEGDDISLLALEAVGVSPVPLPVTDVLTALQTGLLDVIASSPVAALVLQWHTKVKYVTDLPVAYSMGLVAIDARAFERLSTEDQATTRRIMTEVVKQLDEAARRDNQDALRAMQETGIQVVQVDRSQIDGWRDAVESIYPDLRRRADIDPEFMDRMLVALEEFRQGRATARE